MVVSCFYSSIYRSVTCVRVFPVCSASLPWLLVRENSSIIASITMASDHTVFFVLLVILPRGSALRSMDLSLLGSRASRLAFFGFRDRVPIAGSTMLAASIRNAVPSTES